VQQAGSTRRIEHRSYNEAGELAPAAATTLTVIDPEGAATDYPFGPGDGAYSWVLKFSAPGLWQWFWRSGGGDALDQTESGAEFVFSRLLSRPVRAWCTPADVVLTAQLRKLEEKGTLNYELLGRECMAATEFLHERTFRRFRGMRELELRPCCQCSFGFSTTWPWMVWLTSGRLADTPPVIDGPEPCACGVVQEIRLPDDMPDDRGAVVRVLIDGEPFSDWRLDPGRRLVRTDGQSWPCCQRLEDPDSEEGTFSVHVIVGEEAYEIARTAAIELASELYLAIGDPSECRIPTRVNTVTRQGAVYTRVDTTTLARDGFLGLRATDIFLSEFGKKRRTLAIASPDVPPKGSRRVGTA
jgi:hypothetical protein